MRRWLALIALGLALPALAGAPPPPPPAGGAETPPGYTVRPIGAGSQTIKLAGATRIHLRGDGSLRQGRPNLNGIQLESCSQIYITDIQLTNWYQAIRLNGCKGVTFERVVCSKNKQQGWLANDSSGIILRHCVGEKTAVQHSFYSGCTRGRTADILLEDSSFSNSALAEVQVNAESGTAAAQRITIRRCRITNTAFCLNLLGSQAVTIEDSTIKSVKKSLSADRPYGRSWVSQVVLTGGTTLQGRTYVGSGSSVKRQ